MLDHKLITKKEIHWEGERKLHYWALTTTNRSQGHAYSILLQQFYKLPKIVRLSLRKWCSVLTHFIIVCDYNGINEGKQFSLWLSLSLCFCEVLKAVHCSDDRHKLFLLCWKLPCSGQLDKAPPLNECLVSRRFLEEISNWKFTYMMSVINMSILRLL